MPDPYEEQVAQALQEDPESYGMSVPFEVPSMDRPDPDLFQGLAEAAAEAIARSLIEDYEREIRRVMDTSTQRYGDALPDLPIDLPISQWADLTPPQVEPEAVSTALREIVGHGPTSNTLVTVRDDGSTTPVDNRAEILEAFEAAFETLPSISEILRRENGALSRMAWDGVRIDPSWVHTPAGRQAFTTRPLVGFTQIHDETVITLQGDFVDTGPPSVRPSRYEILKKELNRP